jgi:hypothetical protein
MGQKKLKITQYQQSSSNYTASHICEIPCVSDYGHCSSIPKALIEWVGPNIKFVDYFVHLFERSSRWYHEVQYLPEIEFVDAVLLGEPYHITRRQTFGMFTYVQTDGFQIIKSFQGMSVSTVKTPIIPKATHGKIIDVSYESDDTTNKSLITIMDDGKLFKDDKLNDLVLSEIGFRLKFVASMAHIIGNERITSVYLTSVYYTSVDLVTQLRDVKQLPKKDIDPINYNEWGKIRKKLKKDNPEFCKDAIALTIYRLIFEAACSYEDFDDVREIFNPITYEIKFPKFSPYEKNRQLCLARHYHDIQAESQKKLDMPNPKPVITFSKLIPHRRKENQQPSYDEIRTETRKRLDDTLALSEVAFRTKFSEQMVNIVQSEGTTSSYATSVDLVEEFLRNGGVTSRNNYYDYSKMLKWLEKREHQEIDNKIVLSTCKLVLEAIYYYKDLNDIRAMFDPVTHQIKFPEFSQPMSDDEIITDSQKLLAGTPNLKPTSYRQFFSHLSSFLSRK